MPPSPAHRTTIAAPAAALAMAVASFVATPTITAVAQQPTATVRPRPIPTPTVPVADRPAPGTHIVLPLALRRASLRTLAGAATSLPSRSRTPRPTEPPTPFPTEPPTETPVACARPWRLGLTVLADGGFDPAAYPCDGLASASAQRDVFECRLPPLAVTVRAGGPDGSVLWAGTLEPKRADTSVLLPLFLCDPPPYTVQAEPLGATARCWAWCPGTAAARVVTQADFDAASAAVAGEGRTAPVRWSLSRVFDPADATVPALVYLPALRAPVDGLVGGAGGGGGGDEGSADAGGAPACTPTVTLVNAGADIVRVALVGWPAPSAGGRSDAAVGPSAVVCSALLRPGAPLTLDGASLPADLASAYAVSLNTRDAAATADGDPIGGTVADHLCAVLADRLVGDPVEEARFRRAFLDGSPYAGLRLALAYGGPLAVQVSRDCPRRTPTGAAPRPDRAAYNGQAHGSVDVRFAASGDRAVVGGEAGPDTSVYRYPLPAIVADGHRTTVVHLQNADVVTNTVDLALVDAAGTTLPCADVALAPGRSRAVDIAACTGPGGTAAGAAPFAAGWATATGPLAIVVDIVGVADGWPALASYAAPSPAGPMADIGGGVGARLAGPFLFDQGALDGSGAELYVQNADVERSASVTVQVLNGNGDELWASFRSREFRLPPGGRNRIVLQLQNDGVNPTAGARYVRVTSGTPGDATATRPPISAVLVLGTSSGEPFDPSRSLVASAADALPAIRDPLDGTPAFAHRTGRLVLPVVRSAGGGGSGVGASSSTTIAIVNHVDRPGFTDLTAIVFDRNGLVDLTCLMLAERQTVDVDLAELGFLQRGFSGSMVLSAVFWEHDVYDDDGAFVGNILDLGAAAETVSADGSGRTWGGAVPLSPDGRNFVGDLEGSLVDMCGQSSRESRPGPQPTEQPPRSSSGEERIGDPKFDAVTAHTRLASSRVAPARIAPAHIAHAHIAHAAESHPLAPAYLPLALARVTRQRLPHPAPVDPSPGPTATAKASSNTWTKPALVYVPALDGSASGTDADCRPSVAVQNVGAEDAKVVLVAWGAAGAAGACAPAAGPSTVLCSGTLKPGAAWSFASAPLPAGLQSAHAVAFNQHMIGDWGQDVAICDLNGDYLCEVLFFLAKSDAAGEARFRRAYLDGTTFEGIPLAETFGGPIAVHVTRTCPSGDAAAFPRAVDAAAYTGLAHADVAVATHRDGSPAASVGADSAYRYALPALVHDGGRTTRVHVQNADVVCNEVDVLALDGLDEPYVCAHLSLPPGAGRTVDLAACLSGGSPESGGVVSTAGWAVGSGPLAVVVDIVGVAAGWPVLGSYAAPSPARWPVARAGAGTRLTAPLALATDVDEGAGAEVFVQNVDLDRPAAVTVAFRDADGRDAYSPASADLRAGGHATFSIQALGPAPVASVDVTSRPDTAGSAPALAAILVRGIGRNGLRALEPPLTALDADSLSPAFDPALDAALGPPTDGVGTTRLAVPHFVKASTPDNPLLPNGPTSSIAIHNRIATPGFTAFVAYLYDANGLLDYICAKVNERAIEVIDLGHVGFLGTFHGSALVSASFWEHDVFDAQGGFVTNLVDLDAAYGDTMPGAVPRRTWTRAVPIDRDVPSRGLGEPLCPGGFPESRPGAPRTTP